ncbi:MAG: hypothetical protein COT92_00210 [Candidatus Doudnabacteria bacterium CG10_big_fil_rev_8_21_14_0_10_42_18]|uniref:DUF2339 domain-containing protein n=1 Tax=Candidatus Doudnabacteria bacterium CG10_big_fil_rev_8_21_14_0_10_42_18 TaxID=1974552 RepID=A0A2H0VBW9_9BACT|nr:MAG: hypothetical protein COT92_00210 [Candidatus Doudnabacteria bacterium CG10_big_fil_rev_8_21_14_0_10_42_18]
MNKYHKIISIVIAILYVVLMQIFSYPQPVFRFLLPIFLLFLGLVSLYNYLYLKKLNRYNPWVLIRPALVLAAMAGIFFIVPSEFFRSLALILSVVVIFFSESFLENFSEQVLTNEILFILFGLLLTLSAISQFFPGYKMVTLLGVFAAVALSARCFFEFVPATQNGKTLSGIILGLFGAQFFWALTLLPFHFSVIGIILFNLIYFFFIMNYYHIFNILSFKRLQFHLLLIMAASGIVLVSTPWRII